MDFKLTNITEDIKMFAKFFIVFILVTLPGSFSVDDGECPERIGLFQRVGQTRFFISHQNARTAYVDFKEAVELCKIMDMEMASLSDIVQMTVLGRQLEELVKTQELKDTWYWLDAKFDETQEIYVWNKDNSKVNIAAFLYRNPRPVGVGSHLSASKKYDINSNVEQCLTLALPWPGLQEQNGIFYGHQTILDERPCESKKTRHAICETSLPECNEVIINPFILNADDLDYFYNGSWIFGDRKYIISWKPRSFQEAEEYCKDLELNLMEPGDSETHLIPLIKLWNRELTVAQFWTGLKYDFKAGEFINSKGETVKLRRTNFVEEKAEKRSNKLDNLFCVGFSWSYEIKTQSPCPDPTSSACSWSFIDYVPANCNNLFGTICQHPDSNSRTINWDPSYISDVDKALKETALTADFLYKNNDGILRSKFKQPFGVLYCPKDYRMLRAHNESNPPWVKVPVSGVDPSDIYKYDLKDSYWVVDKDGFKKDDTSLCTISEPANPAGDERKLTQVNCTKFAFYICEKMYGASKPSPKTATKSEKMLWRQGPQPRVYPLLEPSSSTDSADDENCKLEQKQRLELAFSLDRTFSMKDNFPIFAKESKSILDEFTSLYPNSVYALTLNSNWDEGAFARAGHENTTDGCYSRFVDFTTDADKFSEKAQTITYLGGRTTDDAAHAAAFTACDTTIGWSKGETDDDGTIIRKFIVVITDAESITELTNPGDRKPFRGDGSDTCDTSLPVNGEQIKSLLEDRDIGVIGFYEKDEYLKHYEDMWFGLLGNRYCADSWHGDFHNVVKVIQTCLNKLLKCVFEDPEGYNTLGF